MMLSNFSLPSLYARLVEAVRSPVDNVFPAHDTAATPLILCAQKKAAAFSGALDAITGHEIAALEQLEVNRDAAVAQLQECYEGMAASVRADAAAARQALELHLIRTDAALEKAQGVVDALCEVRVSF